jgi:hypothetical protein
MGLLLRPVFRPPSALPPALDETALAPLRCDLAFISDDNAPAQALVDGERERIDCSATRRLVGEVSDRLTSEYQGGGFLAHPAQLVYRIRHAAAACGIGPGELRLAPLLQLFDRINRALFREQTLGWLVDCDFKVHLYGEGWDRHEKLARLSRGPVEGDAHRRAIWRATRINLAAAPNGAVSGAVSDGIIAGGFFLLRFCPADVIERLYPPIYRFCVDQRIETNARLDLAAPPGIRSLVRLASRTLGIDLLTEWPDFVPHILATCASEQTRCAAVLWPDEYPQVAFSTRDELMALATRYLYDGPERLRLANTMRRALHERTHHVKVSVSRAYELRGQVVAA